MVQAAHAEATYERTEFEQFVAAELIVGPHRVDTSAPRV